MISYGSRVIGNTRSHTSRYDGCATPSQRSGTGVAVSVASPYGSSTFTGVSPSSGPAPDGDQVRAEPEQRGLALDHADRPEQPLALARVAPARLEVGHDPARALDGQELEHRKPRPLDLRREPVGQVAVRGGEIVLGGRVAMLAVGEIALDDRDVGRIAERAVKHAVQQRRGPRERGLEQHAAR